MLYLPVMKQLTEKNWPISRVTQLLAGPTFCVPCLLLQSKLLLISWLKSLGNTLCGAPYPVNFIQEENPHILFVLSCISILFCLNSLLIWGQSSDASIIKKVVCWAITLNWHQRWLNMSNLLTTPQEGQEETKN